MMQPPPNWYCMLGPTHLVYFILCSLPICATIFCHYIILKSFICSNNINCNCPHNFPQWKKILSITFNHKQNELHWNNVLWQFTPVVSLTYHKHSLHIKYSMFSTSATNTLLFSLNFYFVVTLQRHGLTIKNHRCLSCAAWVFDIWMHCEIFTNLDN
jgi:hypothetical protein